MALVGLKGGIKIWIVGVVVVVVVVVMIRRKVWLHAHANQPLPEVVPELGETLGVRLNPRKPVLVLYHVAIEPLCQFLVGLPVGHGLAFIRLSIFRKPALVGAIACPRVQPSHGDGE